MAPKKTTQSLAEAEKNEQEGSEEGQGRSQAEGEETQRPGRRGEASG
jgi:hypothetical protein